MRAWIGSVPAAADQDSGVDPTERGSFWTVDDMRRHGLCDG